MIEIALSVAAVVANIVGAGMSVPQAVRVLRTREVAGVSASWVGVSIAFNLGWIAWGVATGTWVVVPVSVASVASYLVLAAGLTAHASAGASPASAVGSRVATAMAASSLPLSVALVSTGWAGVGVLLGTLYGAQMAPAAVEAYRRRDLSGVSPLAWSLAWVEALMWLVLGVAWGDHGLSVAGAGGLAVSSLILGRLAWLAAPVTGRVALQPAPVGPRPSPTRSTDPTR